MQVVEHAADMFGALGAVVLEDAEVVVAVAQVEAVFLGGDDGEAEAIAPEADGFCQIGGTDAYMN